MLKDHSCGELNKSHLGKKVELAGWVDRRRDHGGLIFIDLRDRSGIVQVVFNPEVSKECHETASQLRNEYVVRVSGEVALRPAGTENPKIPTGEVEVIARNTEILNTSKTPPFYINEDVKVDENLRLKYRYLDLRRARMRDNLILDHNVMKFMREFLNERGFLDIETPIMIKSTPEGARDYLVPSRLYPGKFYALPQSPQQVKQLLMVAGVEKYYQIARCFRDEDTRADRQPEFTQLDIEMSFIEEEDILRLIEDMLTALVPVVKPEKRIFSPFPRITYAEAMEHYGLDKPDLRFGLQIQDLSDIAAKTSFGVFQSALKNGGKVKGIYAPGCGGYSRHQLEELTDKARELGAEGLVTITLGSSKGSLDGLSMDMVKSAAAKYLTIDQVKEMAARLGATAGDLILVVAGNDEVVSKVLGQLRQFVGYRLGLADPNLMAFAFVVDFPLLEWNKEEKRWQPMHHPFTSPQPKDIPLLDTDPAKVHGRHYDIVCNGYEIGGGSIRIHNPEMQRKFFKLLGYSKEQMEFLFGHLLEAFEYGAPPHGGIALGLARLIMLLAGEETIREVIPFPKNQNAYDLLFDAPAPATEEQLALLHIKLRDV